MFTDVTIKSAQVAFIPVTTRVPLKFGPETLTSVTCARASVTVENGRGQTATGYGETPLNVQWVWPSALTYTERHDALKAFCESLSGAWSNLPETGHALELGHAFSEHHLPRLLDAANCESALDEPMPWLAALVCSSAFDLALHDAYGLVNAAPTYETYGGDFLRYDLSLYLTPDHPEVSFKNHYPADFLEYPRQNTLPAWHLVGGLDPLVPEDVTGDEPDDGYPVLLGEWIRRDGLNALKVKLRGNDASWDYSRLLHVGQIALDEQVTWLSADFNCTVTDPAYVTDILDRLRHDQPGIYGKLLYVEQPFPYDLEANPIDVRAVSARKPLFLDESAHDWRIVKLGRELGWSGVALKTCKTQTGALLAQAWARAHGMPRMVQDLTNPMLAQVPHLLLAAHAATIWGVETNSMQFYPEASSAFAKVHPGCYARRGGCVALDTLRGPGFGYRYEEIAI